MRYPRRSVRENGCERTPIAAGDSVASCALSIGLFLRSVRGCPDNPPLDGTSRPAKTHSVSDRVEALKSRVEKCREAVETFVRIREELLSTRKAMVTDRAREKIDGILRLNRDTLANLKTSLAFAEAELKCAVSESPTRHAPPR